MVDGSSFRSLSMYATSVSFECAKLSDEMTEECTFPKCQVVAVKRVT